MDKVTRQCPKNHSLFDEKGEPQRYQTEVLPLTTGRPNGLTARPNRLRIFKLIDCLLLEVLSQSTRDWTDSLACDPE